MHQCTNKHCECKDSFRGLRKLSLKAKLGLDEAQLDASRRREHLYTTTVALFSTNILQLFLGSISNAMKDALRHDNFH